MMKCFLLNPCHTLYLFMDSDYTRILKAATFVFPLLFHFYVSWKGMIPISPLYQCSFSLIHVTSFSVFHTEATVIKLSAQVAQNFSKPVNGLRV